MPVVAESSGSASFVAAIRPQPNAIPAGVMQANEKSVSTIVHLLGGECRLAKLDANAKAASPL